MHKIHQKRSKSAQFENKMQHMTHWEPLNFNCGQEAQRRGRSLIDWSANALECTKIAPNCGHAVCDRRLANIPG